MSTDRTTLTHRVLVIAGCAVFAVSTAAQQPPPKDKDKPKQPDRFQLQVKPTPEPAPTDKPAEKPAEKTAEPGAYEPSSDPSRPVSDKVDVTKPIGDFRKGARNPNADNQAPYDRLNEYGVLPSSSHDDGGMALPLDRRVSEVFQHLPPTEQITQGQLLGSQVPPLLLEYRILTKEVKPGEEVRAVARVSSVNKMRPFVTTYTHIDYGRGTSVYVNFTQSPKDPTLFLGRGVVAKYLPAGRYIIGSSTGLGDENGHRKSYQAEFHPVLQEPDGTSLGFTITENPAADVTPPVMKRIEVLEKRVKVGDNIHLNVWLEDDNSGINEAQAYWVSPTEAQSLRTDLVADPIRLGLYRASFQIPEWYEGGKWKLLSVKMSDKATNEENLFPPDDPMLQNVTVDVIPAKVDKTPPRLLAIQLSHDEIDRDKSVEITLLAEDELSGVKEAYVSFLSPFGADFNRVTLTNEQPDLRRRSASKQTNVWRGTLKLKPTQHPGKWTVSRVNLSDEANNYANYNPVRDAIVQNLSVMFTDPRLKNRATTEDRK